LTLISIIKAAELLGISRSTAYRLVREGKLPCVRCFGPLRIHLGKLEEMIDAELQSNSRPLATSSEPQASPPPYLKATDVQMNRELDRLIALGKGHSKQRHLGKL
jgi:excisionase family DNA binding protein